jgi:hypothetical protein
VLNLEALCRTIRKEESSPNPWPGTLGSLKMSALNDAVSKAFTGKPYSQSVAAERAGNALTLRMPAPHITAVADEYGLDRDRFAGALASGLELLTNGRHAIAYSQTDVAVAYVPFPEHEMALAELKAKLSKPVDGKHVALVGDYCTGASMIVQQFRRAHQRDADDRKAAKSFGRFVLVKSGIGSQIENWTQDLYFSLAKPDFGDPDVMEMEHPRGKVAFRAAIEMALDRGIDTVIVESTYRGLRECNGKGRLHFGKALQAFAEGYPFRLVMGVGPSTDSLRECAPRLWNATEAIKVAPLSDSTTLRNWIATQDSVMAGPMMGPYDDAMVDALLKVSRGITLLVARYVRWIAMAMSHSGWSRQEVRDRLLLVGEIAAEDPGRELHPHAVERFLRDGRRR